MTSTNSVTKLTDAFIGVCYTCTHYGNPGDGDPATTLAAYASDFKKIAEAGFQVIRTYMVPGSMGSNNSYLPGLDHWYALIYEAYQNDLRVIFELPVNPNNTAGKGWDGVTPWNDYYIDILLKNFLANIGNTSEAPLTTYPVTEDIFKKTVIGFLAGNENIASGSTDESNVDLKKRIEDRLTGAGYSMPVTYCLRCDVMAGDPSVYPNRKAIVDSLAEGVPLFITCYPFEWGTGIANAMTGPNNSLKYYYDTITGFHSGLTLALGETGWASLNPDAGTAYTLPADYDNVTNNEVTGMAGSSEPSLANEAQYYKDAYQQYQTIGYSAMLAFEAFDEPAKDVSQGQFQRYYGLWGGGPDSSKADWTVFKATKPSEV